MTRHAGAHPRTQAFACGFVGAPVARRGIPILATTDRRSFRDRAAAAMRDSRRRRFGEVRLNRRVKLEGARPHRSAKTNSATRWIFWELATTIPTPRRPTPRASRRGSTRRPRNVARRSVPTARTNAGCTTPRRIPNARRTPVSGGVAVPGGVGTAPPGFSAAVRQKHPPRNLPVQPHPGCSLSLLSEHLGGVST
jgi:hypothetical protein